ncbi:MAG: SCO family protein, partial [Microvirgula sp.]
QVIFITVDPERDTPEVLDKYVTAFDPGFVALYGTPAQTAKTASDFNVFYQKVPTGSSYTMDHTALSFVFDRHGKLQLALQHSQSVDECVEDLRQVFALA